MNKENTLDKPKLNLKVMDWKDYYKGTFKQFLESFVVDDPISTINYIIDLIHDAILSDMAQVVIVELKNKNVIISATYKEFNYILNEISDFSEEREYYEECAKIRDILKIELVQ